MEFTLLFYYRADEGGLIVKLKAVFIYGAIGLLLSSCAKSNNSEQPQTEVFSIGNGLKGATCAEIVAECKQYQGKKINNMQLPEKINISENARFFTFDTCYEEPVVDDDTILEKVYGDKYKAENFEVDEMDKSLLYNKEEDVNIIVGAGDSAIFYLNHVYPVEYQMAVGGLAAEDVSYIDRSISPETVDGYNMRLSKLFELCDNPEGFSCEYYGWVENRSLVYDSHIIDYSFVDVKYYGIPFNIFIFENSNKYVDGKKDIYREGLGRSNYISFIDEKEIGSVQLIKYAEPKNIKEYDKLLSFENAIDILKNMFDEKVEFNFEKVELVYVGETEDYIINPDGTFSPENYLGVYHYHPFWAFTTDEKTTMTSGCDGHSGFFIDALTGEISTYTEMEEDYRF